MSDLASLTRSARAARTTDALLDVRNQIDRRLRAIMGDYSSSAELDALRSLKRAVDSRLKR